MAFSEITDRDAEQIGGGFAFVGYEVRGFVAAPSAPRVALMRNVLGSATGGAYSNMIIKPPSTWVRVGGRYAVPT